MGTHPQFKSAARMPRALGNEARSMCGGGEIPNSRQADQGSEKAEHENVEAMGVGVGHSILHEHEEYVGCVSDSPCGISHTANTAQRKGHSCEASRLQARPLASGPVP
jgi:hypothetical protein